MLSTVNKIWKVIKYFGVFFCVCALFCSANDTALLSHSRFLSFHCHVQRFWHMWWRLITYNCLSYLKSYIYGHQSKARGVRCQFFLFFIFAPKFHFSFLRSSSKCCHSHASFYSSICSDQKKSFKNTLYLPSLEMWTKKKTIQIRNYSKKSVKIKEKCTQQFCLVC